MDISLDRAGKGLKEVGQQFDGQAAYLFCPDAVGIDGRGAAPKVERDHGERLVHRLDKVAGAVDSFAVAKSLGKQLSESDANILDGVMLINVKIARRLQLE